MFKKLEELPIIKEEDAPFARSRLEIIFPNGKREMNYVAGRTESGGFVYCPRASLSSRGLIMLDTRHIWPNYNGDVDHQFILFPLYR